jgi:FlaA1/EpsC-like NDP-sugar epimerase
LNVIGFPAISRLSLWKLGARKFLFVVIFEEYNLPANLKILIAWIAGRTTRHMEPNSVFSNTVLEGRVALLTGGGSGIGLEIATQFGKHGAKVAIMGRRQQVLDAAVSYLESHGIEVLFLHL